MKALEGQVITMAAGTAQEWRSTRERDGAVPGQDDVARLLERAAAGEQAAWNEIVDRYTNLLWSVGRAHRLDTAAINDIVQTTWLRLLESLGRIREPERLAGWLATTARRECLAVLRHGRREDAGWSDDDFAELPDEKAPALDLSLLTDERDSVLWSCFVKLSAQCQKLLRVLMAVDPQSYAEVSAGMGMPIGSIGPTRMRCIGVLRKLVGDSGYPFDAASQGGRT
jgi:RNA polymerase sigma factor (sigma-70 family)